MYSQCGLYYGICGIALVSMCRKKGRKEGEGRRKEKEIGVGRKKGGWKNRKEGERKGNRERSKEGRGREGGRREGSKRKEVGNFGRKEEGKKEEERREEGRMEEGKRNVPLNSWLRSAPPELSQPGLELKCGSLRHQRLSLCFLLPAPAGTQTTLKWVFGIWDPASL